MGLGEQDQPSPCPHGMSIVDLCEVSGHTGTKLGPTGQWRLSELGAR